MSADAPSGATRAPLRIGLALGGGSARGLAHIAMLEAFDEVGLKPAVISGTSIGAIVGACYAAGLSAAEIKAHASGLLASRRILLTRLVAGLSGNFRHLWSPRRPGQVDGVTLLEALLPRAVHGDFAGLAIPFRAVAVDYYRMSEVVIAAGPLIPGVAASAALPSVMRPVRHGDRLLIDGGFANPTPFDVIATEADVTIAIDVTGAPRRSPSGRDPSASELWTGALHCLFRTVTREKSARHPPDLIVNPEVTHYATLDFLRIEEILAASEPAKQQLKRYLEQLIAHRQPAGQASP